MAEKIEQVVIEGPQAAYLAADAVAQVYSDRTLRSLPEVPDMFMAAVANESDAFPLTLSPEASQKVLRALEKKSQMGGDTYPEACRRASAFLCLQSVRLASVKAVA